MRRRTLLSTLGAGVLAGCNALGDTGFSNGDVDVEMYADRFDPKRYVTRVGDTVRWGNSGSRAHTVTAYDDAVPTDAAYFASGDFESENEARAGWPDAGGIPSGRTYEHTFQTAGEFGYFCIPHEPAGMVGTVVVRK